MKLPVFQGIVEAVEKHSECRRRKLEWAKGTPRKKRRIEWKRNELVRAENIKSGQRHMAMTHIIVVIAKIAIGAMKCEGREKGRHKGKKCASCESSTHKHSSHRDCPFNKRRAKKETSSGSSTESDGEVSSDDSSEMESGTEERRHKRSCPLSYRNRRPGRTLFPATSNAGQLASSSALEVDCSPSDDVFPLSSKEEKAEMKVRDHVCIHCRSMGSCHLPCCIVGVFSGWYQLNCSEGILITSFCATEPTPLASGSSISLEKWQQAPKVSLRSVADNPALLECCNCDIPVCSGSIVISLQRRMRHQTCGWTVVPTVLSHRDQGVILSERGWLTDNIVCAAQMLLMQFFPNIGEKNREGLRLMY